MPWPSNKAPPGKGQIIVNDGDETQWEVLGTKHLGQGDPPYEVQMQGMQGEGGFSCVPASDFREGYSPLPEDTQPQPRRTSKSGMFFSTG